MNTEPVGGFIKHRAQAGPEKNYLEMKQENYFRRASINQYHFSTSVVKQFHDTTLKTDAHTTRLYYPSFSPSLYAKMHEQAAVAPISYIH